METTLEKLTTETLNALTVNPCEPSISIYMPTHRKHPENLHDVILFKNLIKQLKESLQEKYLEEEVQLLLKPFDSITNNTTLWNKTLDGLAIFSSKNVFKVINLQMPVKELVIVAGKFHTKPLRQYLQSVDRYHILSLNLDNFRLFEGNRFGVSEIELIPEIPQTITDALGEDVTEKQSTVESYGGTGGQSSSMHHGDGGRKDQINKETEKFFRKISLAIDEHYSKPTGLPLLVAALPEHHHLFHKVTKNPSVQKEGIMTSTKFMQDEKLTEMAWEIMHKTYTKNIKELSDKFQQAKGQSRGSDHLEDVIKALAAGQVETVMLEQNRIIPGKIMNAVYGSFEMGELKNPEIGDLLDAIAELATERGTKVIVITKENMPTKSGVAAIYRY